ncbi:MAG: GntR family transcriptional regulator [Gammaproteobacteria bacterium]|nr:GntR family transcriptional regulator [Gammaproteobacteria bacterium]
MILAAENDATTLSDRVFETLCSAIVEGDIPAGSKISEPDLAKKLQVSRASLREAIGRLEACHLVTRKPNVGARVVELDGEQLLEIYHVREALEGMAARLAARHMTEQEIDALRSLASEHSRQIEQDQSDDFQQVGDLDFHFLIVQGSHNSRLINLLCDDLYHLVRMYRHQFGMTSQRTQPALAEHRAIVDVIAAGDGEMAELMMRRHVRASRENLERMLQQAERFE